MSDQVIKIAPSLLAADFSHLGDEIRRVVVVNDKLLADVVPLTDSIWYALDERFGDFGGHSLIASFSFEEYWPTWEVHPHGDEFVDWVEEQRSKAA